ncbi:MFS transporter [Streptomyces sp. NPDC127114]|uniref:MFS transporter n=1 Tax=Streptomyces sp. NPDC127114 TaxID=3345366 RepID=UPI003633D84B
MPTPTAPLPPSARRPSGPFRSRGRSHDRGDERGDRRGRGSGPVALLSVGHACVDVYQGAVSALVPFFVAERHYSYAAAAGVVLAASLLSSLVQPAFGALTDRHRMPWLLPLSTAAAGTGIALSGVSASYPLTLLCVAVAGLGVAAYHPESARVARAAARGSHTAMGWFSLGGNLGFALAPLLVTPVVAAGGLRATPVLAVPAVAGTALALLALRRRRAADGAGGPGGGPAAPDDRRSFVRLSLAVVCRSVVFVVLAAFVPLHVADRTGGGTTAGAAALFVLYLGGAVGTVLGGRLAARWDRVRVVRRSYAATVLAVAGVVLVPGPALFGCVALASAGLYVPFSLQVTLGQDYLPSRVGTASGVTLGLAVSVGGVATPLVGAVADATSLRTALLPLIVFPAIGWLLTRRLPEPAAPSWN